MDGLLHALSIRWRLALLSAGLTFVVLCCFALVIGQLTASSIRSDFNNEMAAAVDDLRDRLRIEYVDGVPHIRTNISDYAGSQHAVVRVLGGRSGAPIVETKNAPQFDQGRLPCDHCTRRIGGYRVETRTAVLRNADAPQFGVPVFIQYGRAVSDVENTIHSLRLFLLLGVVGGSGIALGLGLMLSRRALAPISRLTLTARDIAQTRDPNRRVPVPDSEDEVAELAQTLDEMLQALEASREEREALLVRQRQFVADASHELRTPLTSVLANLELLADVLDGERGEAARSALRSTHRMRRLVGDLLLLARADAKRAVPHEPQDLARVVVEAAAELEPTSGEHELVVHVEPVWVDGARDELHRMVLNLLQNAVQHTPPGTHITAALRPVEGGAELTVSDDGPGIPPELRDRVFDRFVRGEGDHGGTVGLGLSIVRAVAQSHEGRVELADTAPGEGTRFVVTLPARSAPAPEGSGVAGATAAPAAG